MKTINSVQYEVSSGETVTIKVTPTGVGVFVAASLDGHTFSPLPGTANTTPTFTFIANRPVGRTHFVMMEFSFPGAPNTAKYDVLISGGGGGTGTFTIKKTTAVKDPLIRFKVV
jgi:hypothetical protein